MSKGPSTFTKTNVKRAFEAAKMAGVKLARVEIDKAAQTARKHPAEGDRGRRAQQIYGDYGGNHCRGT